MTQSFLGKKSLILKYKLRAIDILFTADGMNQQHLNNTGKKVKGMCLDLQKGQFLGGKKRLFHK